MEIKAPTRDELLAKITHILAEIVDNDSLVLREDTTASDVRDWDSINHVKLLIGLETDLGFRFSVDEVGGVRDVGELITLIQKNLKV